jgi:hypothetical protein
MLITGVCFAMAGVYPKLPRMPEEQIGAARHAGKNLVAMPVTVFTLLRFTM